MYNAMLVEKARWRFEGIAVPQQQSGETRPTRDGLLRELQQAYSFLPHDPANAVARLRGVRAELQDVDRPYVDLLLTRAEAAHRDWRAGISAREALFRAGERRAASVQIQGLRRPFPATGARPANA